MNKALIVIDAQEDFTYGALGTAQAIEALSVITKAVEYATENGMADIFFTRDLHLNSHEYLKSQEGKMLPVPHCLVGTPGWQLCREVLPREFDKAQIIDKKTFGTSRWNDFGRLSQLDEIWICGFCTDICVIANFMILKTMYPEVPIYIIQDACAGTTAAKHGNALCVMESCQAHISTLEELTQA